MPHHDHSHKVPRRDSARTLAVNADLEVVKQVLISKAANAEDLATSSGRSAKAKAPGSPSSPKGSQRRVARVASPPAQPREAASPSGPFRPPLNSVDTEGALKVALAGVIGAAEGEVSIPILEAPRVPPGSNLERAKRRSSNVNQGAPPGRERSAGRRRHSRPSLSPGVLRMASGTGDFAAAAPAVSPALSAGWMGGSRGGGLTRAGSSVRSKSAFSEAMDMNTQRRTINKKVSAASAW
jgi:hypothetical protein